MTKALVVGSGAMFGAYGAGVTAELGRQLGSEYFDSIYASSVGVYAASFFAAGQHEVCEETWRRHVNGRKLINLFRIRNALKLHYLEKIFQDRRSFLDIDALFCSRVRLTYVLTRLQDGKAVYHMPTHANIFRCMTASAATPILHGAVRIGNEMFFDGAFSDPLPVKKALEDGAELVVAVSNKQQGFRIARSFQVLGIICRIISKTVSRLVCDFEALVRETEEALNDPRVIVIRPSADLPLRSTIDTDRRRLNETIDLGIKDARSALEFIRNHK
ncbi:MAG: patatin-like phospholipase family protein [Parcubacteria group bacterium]